MSDPTPLAPLVRSFFENHLACQRSVSPNTVRSYRDGLKLFLRFAAARLGKPVTRLLVADLQEPLVLAFLADLERERGNAIQTRNHRLGAIRVLCEYIAGREPALVDHCRRVATIPRKRGAAVPEIRYLEKDEVTAILGAADRRTAAGRRDHALLQFLYNTGARVQEAADARVGWLHLSAPLRVELLGKGRKWRTCPLWESTAQCLRELLAARPRAAGRDDHLFLNRGGGPLSRSGIADIVGRAVARAAGSMASLSGRRVTPHTFRHTTAMHLLQSGVEINVIRSWLGHVSLVTTNRYVEIDLAMKAKALETCAVGGTGTQPGRWRTDPDLLTWLESL